ncbi:MAG: HAD hydrolase family protein [Desulfobacterales bacterium]
MLAATGCRSTEVAFMGDDLPDISLMRKVGVSVAVADAHNAVKNAAMIITSRAGGWGCERSL